jgi:hypothetical protein
VHDLFSSGVAQSDKKASLSALPLDMEDAITRFVCRGVFVSLTVRQADKQTTDGKKETATNTEKGTAKKPIYVSLLDEFCV